MASAGDLGLNQKFYQICTVLHTNEGKLQFSYQS